MLQPTSLLRDLLEDIGGEWTADMQSQLGDMIVDFNHDNTITVNATGAESTWTWGQEVVHTFTLSGGNIDVEGVWDVVVEGFSENLAAHYNVVFNKPVITATFIDVPWSVSDSVDAGFLARWEIDHDGTRKIFDDDGFYYWERMW